MFTCYAKHSFVYIFSYFDSSNSNSTYCRLFFYLSLELSTFYLVVNILQLKCTNVEENEFTWDDRPEWDGNKQYCNVPSCI